jgi:hypothetical protein
MAEGLVDGTAFAVDASLMLPMPTNCALLQLRSAAGSDDVDWEGHRPDAPFRPVS